MPDDLPIVLHVGGMKAGSSALQYDLTWQPIREAARPDGLSCEYVSLLPGQLLRGTALQAHAAHFAAHYSMSDQLHSLLGQPEAGLAAGLAALEQVRREGHAPILSYETWLTAEPADIHAFADALTPPVRVVVYVRPPVQWLASLYDQRDYTKETNPARFLKKWLPKARWNEAIDTWRSAPGVSRVDVRSFGDDICTDFCDLLGCAASGREVRHNRSLPAVAVELLERQPLPPHVSLSEAKFALWRWLPDTAPDELLTTAPLPFDQPMVSRILNATRDASHQLLEHCDADTRQAIESDTRWWSDDPQLHGVATGASLPAEHQQAASDAFTLLLWESLLRADAAWRQGRG